MHKLKCLFISLVCSTNVALADSISAAADSNMAAQKAACDKNTAMEWSSKYNRCIGKQAAIDTRNNVNSCDSYTDVTAKQKCQMAIAEKSTGLSSDTSKLNQGNTTGSMMMNGAASVFYAYSGTSLLHTKAKGKENSACTSKKIFGVTALAGLASDVYLKMRAKKKVKELEGKYAIDTKTTAYEAQIKALEYLKEEQETVASIAGLEKKRNMMLTLGYGLAAGWAAYELTPYGANPDCVPKKEEGKSSTSAASETAASPQTPVETTPTGAQTFEVRQGSVEVRDLPPLSK